MKKFLYFVLVSILSFCSVLASDTSTYNSEQKYNYELKKAIYNNWEYKGKESVSAEAGFTILKNGFITDIDIKKTGNDALDESILDAITKTSPFKPFPPEIKYESLDITLAFNYTYTANYTANNSQTINQRAIDLAYKQYFYKAKTLIYNKFPTSYSWLTDSIVIDVTVASNGTIKRIDILDSSGSKRYDANVVKKLMNIRLPAFPPTLPEKELTFTFDVNKNTRFYPIYIPTNW